MHPIERQLYLDHLHITQVLRCFERALDGYRNQSDSAGYLALILDVLDYIEVYPQRWHHPVEDRIYALLLQRVPTLLEVGLSLTAEHKRLEQLTNELNHLFTAIANDSMVPMSHLMRISDEFLEEQLAHLERENRQVFPLLARTLCDPDWQQLERECGLLQDPLFGDRLRQDYENLHASILTLDRHLSLVS